MTYIVNGTLWRITWRGRVLNVLVTAGQVVAKRGICRLSIITDVFWGILNFFAILCALLCHVLRPRCSFHALCLSSCSFGSLLGCKVRVSLQLPLLFHVLVLAAGCSPHSALSCMSRRASACCW